MVWKFGSLSTFQVLLGCIWFEGKKSEERKTRKSMNEIREARS
jgi:hypothetical protein